MNAVDLQFDIAPGQTRYRDVRCRPWSGPEAVHVKRGHFFTAPWTTLSSGPGSGADDPLPQSVTLMPGLIAYSDSPGPNIGPMVAAREGRPARVYTVQNFTGWIEGIPAGGNAPERITPVVAWYSIMHLRDANWQDHAPPPQYTTLDLTGTEQGWRPTGPPSI